MGVDVVIDSAPGSRMDELTAVGSPVPAWLKAGSEPVAGAILYFVVPGEETMQQNSLQCAPALGMTFRLNAAHLKGALLSVAAGGLVRVTVRVPGGRVLGEPLMLEADDSARVIRWK